MKNFLKISVIFLTSFSLISCSSYRPLLDKNSGAYLTNGEEGANRDVAECKKIASDALDQYKAERAAKEAGRKAVIGGVVGAASGLIFGGNGRSTLGGGLIGVGVGAAIGGLSVLGEDRVKPDQMKQRYMTKCLSERGYSVLGWI